MIPVFKHASKYSDKTALRDLHGDYTYRGLFLSSRQFSNQISQALSNSKQERVAILMPNDANYVITQWACWMSGQIGRDKKKRKEKIKKPPISYIVN